MTTGYVEIGRNFSGLLIRKCSCVSMLSQSSGGLCCDYWVDIECCLHIVRQSIKFLKSEEMWWQKFLQDRIHSSKSRVPQLTDAIMQLVVMREHNSRCML